MVKRLLCLLFLLLVSLPAIRAQEDAALSHYFMATSYYNPAAAGNSEDLRMLALFNQQMSGFPNAQRTFFLTADMPLKLGKTNHGIGLAARLESIGLFQNTFVGVQYAYKQKLLGGVLSGGIQLGFVNKSFEADSIYIPQSDYHDREDEAFPEGTVSGMAFDINLGLFYTHKNFYAGIGYTHITAPEIQYDEMVYSSLGSLLNFMGGYNIKLNNPLFELKPSVFYMTDLINHHLDVTARVEYNKMFNGGISWKMNESIGILLGANIGRFSLGYSFGNHEIVLQYRLKLKKTKTGNTRHKSVRIL